MKAVVLREPKTLVLEERPLPDPGPDQVRIKIKNATICHTDFFVIDGLYPNTKYPTVVGHEFAGIIDACGQAVNLLHVGDRVTAMAFEFCGMCKYCLQGKYNTCENIKGLPFDIDGCYQEYMVMKETSCMCIPDGLSLREAAVAEAAANGCSAIERANIEAGETVVIVGPGPIGLLSLQWAKLQNPEKTILTGTRESRLEMGRKLGADYTINVNQEAPVDKIMSITKGKGVDAIIFCGGSEQAFIESQFVLKKYGRLVIEAVPERSDEQWRVAPFDFTAKAISIIGASGYTGNQFRKTLSMMALKNIDVDSLITHSFGLHEYEKAFKTSQERIDGAIKVQFRVEE